MYSPVGFKFAFTDTHTIVTPVDMAELEDAATKIPACDLIAQFLRGEGQSRTCAEIAKAIGAKPDTVKKAVSRPGGKGQWIFVLQTVNRKVHVGLAEWPNASKAVA
jgi:hypothetical protein